MDDLNQCEECLYIYSKNNRELQEGICDFCEVPLMGIGEELISMATMHARIKRLEEQLWKDDS